MSDNFDTNVYGINPVDADTGSSDIYFSNEDYAKIIRENKKGSGNNSGSATAVADGKKKKKKKRSSVSSTLLFFVIVIAVSMLISVYAVFCINDVFGITKTAQGIQVTYTQTIESPYEAIDLLAEHDLITCKNFCKLLVKMELIAFKYSTELDGPFQPGTYYLNGKMGVENMLIAMLGEAETDETIPLTFPEGYTVADIVKRLVDNEVCKDKNALISAIQSTEFSYALVADLKEKDTVPYRLEGYLFPDTYEFFIGQSPSSTIETFLKNTESKITEEDRARAEELGFSIHEIITIASIVQSEAGSSDQMELIAGIIENRLADKANFPSLGCQSTSDYITKKVGPSLTSSSGHTSEYYLQYYSTNNDSTVVGLPEGPICNPGTDAIHAALYPASTKALYFFHDSKKNLYTAETYSEFKSKIQQYAPYLDA